MSKDGVQALSVKVEEFVLYSDVVTKADGLSPNDKSRLISRLAEQLSHPQQPPVIGSTVYISGFWDDQHPCIVKEHLPDGRIKAYEESMNTLHILRSWITV